MEFKCKQSALRAIEQIRARKYEDRSNRRVFDLLS